MNPGSVRRRTTRALAGTVIAAAALLGLGAGTAHAAGDVSVSHVERTDDGFSVLVDVPAGSDPDLSTVSATVNGQTYDATAQSAQNETRVARKEILVIDTSDSMRDKLDDAKRAADLFLDDAPANVSVGVVTFDSRVTEALDPTTDRDQARSVVDGLQLSQGTKLYDGVLAGLRMAGTTGQRTLLVISDGADTNSAATLASATATVDAAQIGVDVVALDQGGEALTRLKQLAGDNGTVLDSSSTALEQAFSAEAEALQRQIAVDITVPADVRAAQSSISVSLTAADGTALGADVLLPEADAPPTAAPSIADATAPPVQTSDALPHWVLYAGVILFGLALVVALVMLVPARPEPMTAEQRVATYTDVTLAGNRPDSATASTSTSSEDVLASAKEAIGGVLSRNRGLEARIAQRLDAAGSELKAPEWVLVHLGVTVLVTVLGLLISGGNLFLTFVFLVLGAVGPWIYLGIRKGRRRKAFNSVLPETLQLISGSLSAGLSLAQSVNTIVREGAEPIAGEFRRVLVETRLGVSIEDAFDGVAERFESRDFAWVVMAIRIQRQVGGNLSELLETVAATMREREYMRRQVAALAAEGKLSAIVLGLLPPLFLLYLSVTNFAYVKPMFVNPIGWLMLAGGALLLGLGVFWMSRLVKVEV